MLDDHGPEARHVVGIWWLMFGSSAAVYVVVAGLIFWALARGRVRGARGGGRLHEDAFVLVGGVVVPALILAVLAVVTVRTTTTLRTAKPGAVRIAVVGHRWWWEVRYDADGIVTANEVHVPVGRPIEVGLESDDVIHSFWVPQLAGKVDLIPGQRNVLRFSVRDPGTYRGQCAEYCAIGHANMHFVVIADAPGVYARWVARHRLPGSGPTSEQAAIGQAVFQRESCAGCHTIRGTEADGRLGPDLTDFGSRLSIGAGVADNTAANLAAWITDSQAMKPGNLMPPLSLARADVDALVAYLEGSGR